MRKIALSLAVAGVLLIPSAGAIAGPVEDAERTADGVVGIVETAICLVKHGYFGCFGD